MADHAPDHLTYNDGARTPISALTADGAMHLLAVPQRRQLRLVGVLCIASSHYVAFAATNCSASAHAQVTRMFFAS